MPPSDADELRGLQQKAYGRDGGLTDAEAARLRELEDRHSAPAETAGPSAAAHAPEEDARPGGGIRRDAPPEHASPSRAAAPVAPEVASAEPAAETSEAAAPDAARPETARAVLRRHWRAVAAASAVLVALGIGTGWMLFGRGDQPPAVPASQQEALAAIEEGDFDEGSVRFLGEEHGVAVWWATSGGGTRECIVVTHADRQGQECRALGDVPAETEFDGLGVSIDFEEDGQSVTVWATIIPDISGKPATIVQRAVTSDAGWESQYTEAELADVRMLEEAGFDGPALLLVGHDEERAVWQGWRAEETCLAAVVDGEVHAGCGPIQSEDEMLRLRIGTTQYEFGRASGSFTIIRNLAPGEGVDPLELGGEHGDPIEVTPDEP